MSGVETVDERIEIVNGETVVVNVTRPGDYVVCNLASLNLGKIDVDREEELREVITSSVRALDNVIDLNYFPVPYARINNLNYRPIGLGVSGYHHLLALKGVSWESQEHLDYANRSVNVNSLFLRPAMSLLKVLAYAVILTFFGLNWQTASFTAGLMYAFIQYINQLFDPLIEVTQNFATLQTSMVSAERVFAMLDQRAYEPTQAPSDLEVSQGRIEFRNVSFSYDGKRDVLKDISFQVQAGETIAFVGHTGSGKSSIINLFMRFYEFDRGQILIDGVDIREYSQPALRKAIGLVLQDPFLYHGTIESNIKMYQDHLSRSDVQAAAEFVDADAFISQLPEGYDQPVTERGSTLSSGQRQLIAFARTVAAKPKILILDEATANIDSETEEVIQHSLKKMRKGRTTIAIAHRLSTIQDADCIYVLDKGRIIESGTHDQLLALEGTYQKMYQLQAGQLQQS